MQLSILFTGWLFISEQISNVLMYIGISTAIADGIVIGLGVILGMNWMLICEKAVQLYKDHKPW